MIYIVNCYPILETGHFWNQDRYFRKFFRALDFPYLYINPSAELAAIEDGSLRSPNYRYIQISAGNNFIENAIQNIVGDIKENLLQKAVIFFPWIPQFNEVEMIKFSKINSDARISIAGVSVRNSEAIWGSGDINNRFVHQSLFLNPPFEIFWIGESIPESLSTWKSIRHIPEYAETEIRFNENKIYDLCFHGMLSPYRGLFEVLVIALFNPKLRINIRGYSFSKHQIWRPIKFKFTRYTGWKDNLIFSLFFSICSIPIGFLRFLPNIKFSNIPFLNEKELDENLSYSRTLFYCPKLPHGSGLMTKSLSAGIPVLWNGLPGQAHNYLNVNFPQGHFRYWEIFVPGKIYKRIRSITPPVPQKLRMWNAVFVELSELKKYF